ncbi:MAG: LD-carboxypeptidase [Sphingobacteriaceae bacterium]|nr:LD-carboxypeptidase [Sphingobacteriaceae bacterium]
MQNRREFLSVSGMLTLGSLLVPKNIFAINYTSQEQKIKAPSLKTGDTIAIASPAGAVWNAEGIDTFVEIIKNLGFKVRLGKTLTERYGYFAGTDELRANELNELFADKNIKGIFCMKGGWGCARILDKLDYSLIRNNPKVLIGFSDITALLLAITQRTGLITFHGPVGNSGWNNFTRAVFKDIILDGKKLTYPDAPEFEEKIKTLNSGIVEGEIWGGNLTVLTSLIGSTYLPDWKNKILFVEEAKEEPYSIDRMLTQLKLAGVLENIAGFVFGKCSKCLAEEPEKAFTFEQVLEQHIKPLKIPAFYGAPIGHIENKLTIPIGAKIRINADHGKMELLENAVS